MACNCIEESTEKTLAHLKEQYPDRTYDESDTGIWGSLGYSNVGFSLGAAGRFFYFPFKTRYTFTKTNGEMSKPKTETVNMQGVYCPFCGCKFKEDQNDETGNNS